MMRMIIHRWASQMGASKPPREDVWDVTELPTSWVLNFFGCQQVPAMQCHHVPFKSRQHDKTRAPCGKSKKGTRCTV